MLIWFGQQLIHMCSCYFLVWSDACSNCLSYYACVNYGLVRFMMRIMLIWFGLVITCMVDNHSCWLFYFEYICRQHVIYGSKS